MKTGAFSLDNSIALMLISWFCYWLSHIGPQQGFSWLVLFEPIKQDPVQFRCCGKFYSVIEERGGGSSGSRGCAPGTGRGRGCFIRISSLGRGRGGVLAGPLRLHGSGSRSQRQTWRLCAPHAAAVLRHRVVCSFCARFQAELSAQPFHTRNSGLKDLVGGLCTQHPMSK